MSLPHLSNYNRNLFRSSPGEKGIRQVGFERERSFHRITRSGQMGVEAFLASLGGIVAIPDMRLGQPRPRERELGDPTAPRVQKRPGLDLSLFLSGD